MATPNSLHADLAAYRIQQAEKWDHSDLTVVKGLASVYQVRPLLTSVAAEFNNEKLASIAATVIEIEDQIHAQGRRCYRKVTDAQRHALATALLEKFGTAREVVKAAWGLTDQQIDDAEE